MTRINRKVEYALIALRYMSEKVPGQLTTAKEVVDATGAPFDATARVMQLLAQKNVLKSEQGAYGGYAIVKDLNKITFYDLIVTVLGPLEVVKCLHDPNDCELAGTCNIQSPLTELNERLIEFYKGLNLLDLLRVKNQSKGEDAQASAKNSTEPSRERLVK